MNPIYFDAILAVTSILNILNFFLFFRRAMLLLKIDENGFSKILAVEQLILAGFWLWFFIRSIQVQSIFGLESDFNFARLGALITVMILGLALLVCQILLAYRE